MVHYSSHPTNPISLKKRKVFLHLPYICVHQSPYINRCNIDFDLRALPAVQWPVKILITLDPRSLILLIVSSCVMS